MKLKPIFPPPGFRTRKWWKILLASLFYIFYIYNLIGFHASDDPIMNNACIIFMVVSTIVSLDICTSWTGIYDILPFVTHKNLFLRCLFKFLFVLAAIFVILLLTTIVLATITGLTK